MSMLTISLTFLLLVSILGIDSNVTIIETATDPSLDNETVEYSSNKTETRPAWLKDALKDIAYYLRTHKFNEYDRRYETDGQKAKRNYFQLFPKPPLRSLHWEVHKMCDKTFLDCVAYLNGKIDQTAAQRRDDTLSVIAHQNWTMEKNREQIHDINRQCLENKRKDDRRADPFQGPLERYQWRVTASYFMCWFAMLEEKDLAHLEEKCDNFAECLDPDVGTSNRDWRADDSVPFSCALYSFCPDPCCAARRSDSPDDCWNSRDLNPCFEENPEGRRECRFKQSENTNFRDMVLNRWNVSCQCPAEGFKWNSMFGTCTDVDECATLADDCDANVEACLNLPGKFRCVCKWGHTWNEALKRCEASSVLSSIKLTSKKRMKDEKLAEELPTSIVGRIKLWFKKLFGLK